MNIYFCKYYLYTNRLFNANILLSGSNQAITFSRTNIQPNKQTNNRTNIQPDANGK